MHYGPYYLRVRLIAAVLTIPLAFAADAQGDLAKAPLLHCSGPFARTATHTGLVKAFGANNVTYADVNRAEGEVVKATILFAKDPKRRLEVEWFDAKQRARPSVITVFGESQWTGPLGVKNGMMIEEIEKLAGKPFKINGFEFDVAGAAHVEGTRLEKLPGGCAFGGHFEIEGGLPQGEQYKRFVGEVEIDSNDPLLLTLKPKLWIFTLSYPAQSAE
jgi:hypothetical protein